MKADVLSSTSRLLGFCIQYVWPCGCPGEQAVILHPVCALIASTLGKVCPSCCGYVFINMHLLQAGYHLKMMAYRFVFPRPALVEPEPPKPELRAFCSSKGSADPILFSAWSYTSGGVDPLLEHLWSSPLSHKVAA